MALYHEDIVDIDLGTGTVYRSFSSRVIGEGDNAANRYGVRLFKDGEPVSAGGATVMGYFIRQGHGDTVVINGGTTDTNVAFVTLPQACYAYEGAFSLVIKLVGGGVTGTMRIVDGTVANTTTETQVDPGSVIPDISELLALIEEMEAAMQGATELKSNLNHRPVTSPLGYGYFVNGFHNFPNRTNESYRVCSEQVLQAESPTFITVEDGFEIYINYVNQSETATEGNSGWQPKSAYLTKGRKFTLSIRRASEDTTETADIAEFTGKVKIYNERIDTWHDVTCLEDFTYRGKLNNYETGAQQNADSYWFQYLYKNPKFKRIKAHCSCYGRDVAEIALYSGDTIDSSTYLKSASQKPGSWDQDHWTYADIPENCKLVVVTSREVLNDGSHFTPEILVDFDNMPKTRIQNVELTDYSLKFGYRDISTGEPTDERYLKRVTSDVLKIHSPTVKVTVDATKGYRCSVSSYYGTTLVASSNWYDLYNTRVYGDRFVVTVKREVNGAEQDMITAPFSDIGLKIIIEDGYVIEENNRLLNELITPEKNKILERTGKKIYGGTIFNGYRMNCHMLHENIGAEDTLIPPQSLDNIEIAHRLGYRCFELNAHVTATPGQYICMHGASGKIGNELVARDGTDISGLKISDVTAETFRNDYVYRTTDEKYRKPVTFLDEALTKLKEYGMIAYVGYDYDIDMIEYTRGFVGDNFILGLYTTPYYGLRSVFYDGPISYYGELTTEEAEGFAKQAGYPLFYSITPEMVRAKTDAELIELRDAIHKAQCKIGFAGVYMTPAENRRMWKLGYDFSGSGYEVEDFLHGNIVSLHDNNTFTAFTHNGTVSGGTLTLVNGQAIRSDIPQEGRFLTKAALHIKFAGTMVFTMGDYIENVSITSDGRTEEVLTTFLINGTPNFTAVASGNATITSCVFDASEC